MTEKTLEQLEALHNRLVGDVQRVKAIDPLLLNRNSLLVKNLQRCEEEIRQKKAGQ